MMYKLRGMREGNFLITDSEAEAIDRMTLAQVMQMVRDGRNFKPPPPLGGGPVAAQPAASPHEEDLGAGEARERQGGEEAAMIEGVRDAAEGFVLGVNGEEEADADEEEEEGEGEGAMGEEGDGGWKMSKDEIMCEIVVESNENEGEGGEGEEGLAQMVQDTLME